MPAKFPFGQVVATRGALATLTQEDVESALKKHAAGEWGELCDEDRQANDDALKHGARLLSAYRSTQGEKFWVITEWDRSATTVLLPEEY